MQALTALYNSGQNVVDILTSYRNTALINFNRQVEALNNRGSVTNRLLGTTTLVNFVTTDFLDVDQTQTSATIRADAGSVSLCEKNQPLSFGDKSTVFTTNLGTAQSISKVYDIYTVTAETIPTGTFIITLNSTININILNLELTAISSNPVITITTSEDNVVYTPVNSYSLNGYNLIANLDSTQVKYINIAITPAVPDTLSGNTYTFGLISVETSLTNYEYSSEFVTLPINFCPTGQNVEYSSTQQNNFNYLNFSSQPGTWYEVNSGSILSLPGVSSVNLTGISLETGNYINTPITFNSNDIIYPNTLTIKDNTGINIPVIFGLSPSDLNILYTRNKYIAVNSTISSGDIIYTLCYIDNSYTGSPEKTFDINYTYGPKNMSVALKVQLSTTNNTLTPIFNGATLNEV
jgi:hypothetical protein